MLQRKTYRPKYSQLSVLALRPIDEQDAVVTERLLRAHN